MKSYIFALLASYASADVHFHTGGWAGEVTWEIYDEAGKKICNGGPYPRNNEQYETHCEL